MADFKPNSHRAKEEARKETERNGKRADKVVTGRARVKKKSELSKFKDSIISEDIGSVKSYILMDVMIPAAKKMLEDIVVDGIHMMLHGESGRGARRSSVDRVSYDRYSRRPERRYSEERRRSFLDYDDIVFNTRGEAEKVLAAMDDIMLEYGLVRVADLYDLAGLTCEYPGMDYGWTNIQNAGVIRVRDGYIIKMPRAIPIK